MSRENVEIVGRFLDAYITGRYDAAAGELHLEAEWDNTASFPGERTLRGRAAIQGFWRDLFSAFPGSSASGSGMEVEKIVDVDDLVVAALHGWGRGAASGVPFDRRWAHGFRFRDGKVVRVTTYGSYRRAAEALGLQDRVDPG